MKAHLYVRTPADDKARRSIYLFIPACPDVFQTVGCDSCLTLFQILFMIYRVKLSVIFKRNSIS